MSDSSKFGRRLPSGSTPSDDLLTALGEGDPQRVRALIEAGADVCYKRDDGYDALLDAIHGRDVRRDPRLLELLKLLVDQGIDLSGISSYGESGLRVLSRLGRFDAVRLLLSAGADRDQLEWTPLMEAVALGSLADVQAVLVKETALEEKDCWSRTAWLIALLTGDIAKAKLLRERGADPTALGRCGCPPLFFAIRSNHPDMLRWLLQEKSDIHQSDEFGMTPLIEAVENDDLECVEILLDAGADVTVNSNRTTALIEAVENDNLECVGILLDAGADVEATPNHTALSRATSREIILRLLDAGADPADADHRTILGLQTTEDEALEAVTLDEFLCAFTRKFAGRNPERMNLSFWEAMIRCGVSAYEARQRFEEQCGSVAEPVWCAQRFGQSLTLLPDGRTVRIGGEHEDFYDPDFCIYNDVFVHERDGSIAVYGYPESEFPPTDFHTATLVGDFIYVIGSLGYRGTRHYGETPVYLLDLHTLRMDRLEARGEAPGWIYKHRAIAMGLRGIRVWGGTVVTGNDDTESHEQNSGAFVLDLNRLLWHRESRAAKLNNAQAVRLRRK